MHFNGPIGLLILINMSLDYLQTANVRNHNLDTSIRISASSTAIISVTLVAILSASGILHNAATASCQCNQPVVEFSFFCLVSCINLDFGCISY